MLGKTGLLYGIYHSSATTKLLSCISPHIISLFAPGLGTLT